MPLDIPRIQAICFDVDGTLRDTDDQWVAKMYGILRPARFMFRDDDLHLTTRRAVMAIEEPGNLALHMLDRLRLDDLAERIANRLRREPPEVAGGQPMRSAFLEGVFAPITPVAPDGAGESRPVPLEAEPKVTGPGVLAVIAGVEAMLKGLYGRYPLAVVSARPRRSTMKFIDGQGLAHYFQAIATGQTTRYTKPFPDPIYWAAAQMGVKPEHCLMVGDTTVDIRAGRAAGAQTVGVLCGFGDQQELARAGADLILPTTADLTAILLAR